MYLAIGSGVVPPRGLLREVDIFTELNFVVHGAEHAFIHPETLCELAGAVAHDGAWRKSCDGMVGYALSKGWVAANGSLRAHIECESSQQGHVSDAWTLSSAQEAQGATVLDR